MDSFLRIEKEEPALRGHWTFNPQLQTLVGGRQRASFDELPGWWHRMQITGVDVPGSPRKELRFASLTQRARNEVRLQATDRDIVDKFVSRAMGSINYDERISSTLFELLLPNEFKDGSVIEGNLVLLLDDESAAYPWELLQDPLDQQPGAVRRPLICRRGILRQLETKVFRENVRASDARAVLVVGDPRSNFPPLAGAQEEARIAAQALEPRFAVNHLHRPEGDQVLMELRTGSYRVVHFAGHGVYEYPDSSGQKRTGMVIGDEMYLSPMLVEGIRRVPDLVFVNCCHLGFSAGKSTSEGDPSRIAANVAQQFIRIGARAVIAAGWAVEDQSAAEFARLFYELMLSGRTFGEATVAARKQIYDRFPQFNTWGAYQCYGDPDFRLVTEDTATSAARAEEFNFAAPALAVMQIEDIASQLQLLGDRDVEPHLKRLAALEKWLDADERKWLDKPGIQRALALAYWEALRYEEALRCFDRAVMKDAASLTLSDLEQLANLTTRAAVDVFLAGEAGTTRQKALDMLSSAQRYLDWLDLSRVRVAAAGADGTEQKLSPERLALFGSVYKRMTWVADPGVVPAMTAAVRKMKTHYQQALNGAAPDAYYHLLNVIASKLVELWVSTPNGAKPRSAGLKALQEELKKAEGYIKQALETKRDDRFALASRVDVKLYQQLCAGDLGGSALDALAKDYAGVRGLMSRRMFGSTRDQIAWLAVVAGHTQREELQSALGALADRIGAPSAQAGARV
jgi:tetratricopeptide (TPR) repeat protein